MFKKKQKVENKHSIGEICPGAPRLSHTGIKRYNYARTHLDVVSCMDRQGKKKSLRKNILFGNISKNTQYFFQIIFGPLIKFTTTSSGKF